MTKGDKRYQLGGFMLERRRSMDEVQHLLASLLPWRGTRWYVKHDDGRQPPVSDWWLE